MARAPSWLRSYRREAAAPKTRLKQARAVLLLLLLFFGVWCFYETSTCIAGYKSRDWTAVDGKVIRLVEVTRATRLGGKYMVPVVEYEVRGVRRENRRAAFGTAWKIPATLAVLRVGDGVRVWVNPANPDESVRFKGVMPGTALAAVFLGIFTLVVSWYLVRLARKGEAFVRTSADN